MFKKVLIAEDEDFMNDSLGAALEALGIVLEKTDYVSYCDDAFSRVKKAVRDGNPYELLIIDLSFKEDLRKQEIPSGSELIKAVKGIQPDIKVLVFSVTDLKTTVDSLFSDSGINGYVTKDRGAKVYFRSAIQAIYQGKQFYPPNLKRTKGDGIIYELSSTEMVIINLIAEGRSQKWVADYLKEYNIIPYSLSSVEKALSRLKTIFDVSTLAQLICHFKDRGII
ncbi:response regulator [Pedobacter sp. MR22-3]|uniref:response regulator n=1 Tax=Pedobacter sp. MR22-3 TaxID=2994552 RepID=UPI002246EA50|nr:response regulator [Pedobacter sp. MR22-3]MCX2584326.1 response regulator [Pedobacter sp. MR22-3]